MVERGDPAAVTTAPTDGRELRRQGRQTMARLLDAGMTVLAERGYHAARVDDVVRTADVSHGTFYLYFSNKEELVRALAVQCADEMTELVRSLGPVGPDAEGLAALRTWLAAFTESYGRYGVVIRAWMEDQVGSRELSRLGVETFHDVVGAFVTNIAAARPGLGDQAELDAAALLAMIERFTYFTTSRDLDLEREATLDSLAQLVHQAFFGG